MTQSTRVDLGLRERSQPGEAQRGPRCPTTFRFYCVTESGAACLHYSDGRCAQVPEEVTL